jgi:cytochrome c
MTRRIAAMAVVLPLIPLTGIGCRSDRHEPTWTPPAGSGVTAPSMQAPTTTEGLIAFVQAAATQVHERGTAAFDEFARRGSVWNHDDTYLFVTDDRTDRIVFHGANPELVGRKMEELVGAEGRDFGGFTEDTLELMHHAWAFYKWRRPSGGWPVWKASYNLRVAGPSGERFIVGSGVFELNVDRKLVTELVDMAAAWVEHKRQKALKLIRDPNGPFVYRKTRVFVINTSGDVLADAFYPYLEQSNQLNLKSADGKPVMRDLIALIEREPAGWLTGYRWRRPVGGPAGHKDIYVRRVSAGKELLGVGSGLYTD